MKQGRMSKRDNMAYLYIMPWILGFLMFKAYPLVSSFYHSFTEFNVTDRPFFIGIENYITIFSSDALFYTALRTTLKFLCMALPLKIITALVVAMILNQKIKGIGVYRTLYYIPSIFGGSVAISILWTALFRDLGLVNRVLASVHLPAVPWLTSPKMALFTLSLLSAWQFGSSMVLFLAALKQVPEDLYEAARIDGAGKTGIFFRVTLPMISPVLFFNITMQMINIFQDFTGAFVITKGGPLHSTYLFALKLYDEAFHYFKMGYASALSWVLFAIIFCFTVLFSRFSSMAAYYEDGGKF
jgi:oligogalacturonide transport system permease protein